MNTITIKNEGHEEDFNNLRDVISYYSGQDREVSFSNIEIHNMVCGAVYNMKKKWVNKIENAINSKIGYNDYGMDDNLIDIQFI